MLSSKIEQRVNLKFFVRLEKSTTESFHMLMEAYGENCLSRDRLNGNKKFSESREDVENDDRTERSSTSKIEGM